VEGHNLCANDQTLCKITVNSTGTTGAPTGLYSAQYPSNVINPSVLGFTVNGNSLQPGYWNGNLTSGDIYGGLCFSSPTLGCTIGVPVAWSYSFNLVTMQALYDYVPAGDVVFTRVPDTRSPNAVPGPIPLLGAAAAFGYSRKLRKRITATNTTAPTLPAG